MAGNVNSMQRTTTRSITMPQWNQTGPQAACTFTFVWVGELDCSQLKEWAGTKQHQSRQLSAFVRAGQSSRGNPVVCNLMHAPHTHRWEQLSLWQLNELVSLHSYQVGSRKFLLWRLYSSVLWFARSVSRSASLHALISDSWAQPLSGSRLGIVIRLILVFAPPQ